MKSLRNCLRLKRIQPQAPGFLAYVLLATSKTILEGGERIFKQVPGDRGHSNCNYNKQTKLYPAWETKKVDIHLGEYDRNKKIYERMIDINSVTYLTCIYQRLQLENFEPNSPKS